MVQQAKAFFDLTLLASLQLTLLMGSSDTVRVGRQEHEQTDD